MTEKGGTVRRRRSGPRRRGPNHDDAEGTLGGVHIRRSLLAEGAPTGGRRAAASATAPAPSGLVDRGAADRRGGRAALHHHRHHRRRHRPARGPPPPAQPAHRGPPRTGRGQRATGRRPARRGRGPDRTRWPAPTARSRTSRTGPTPAAQDAGFTALARARGHRRARRRAPAHDGSRPPDASNDDLVVHQGDVQAVVNALWAGGAEAMSIMNVRVLTTSAVRCVGNTLLLHGRVYSPPFKIVAIGDPAALQQALASSQGVRLFKDAGRRLPARLQGDGLHGDEFPHSRTPPPCARLRCPGERAGRPRDRDGRHRDQTDEPTAFLPKVDRPEPAPGRPTPAGTWPEPVLPPRSPAPRASRQPPRRSSRRRAPLDPTPTGTPGRPGRRSAAALAAAVRPSHRGRARPANARPVPARPPTQGPAPPAPPGPARRLPAPGPPTPTPGRRTRLRRVDATADRARSPQPTRPGRRTGNPPGPPRPARRPATGTGPPQPTAPARAGQRPPADAGPDRRPSGAPSRPVPPGPRRRRWPTRRPRTFRRSPPVPRRPTGACRRSPRSPRPPPTASQRPGRKASASTGPSRVPPTGPGRSRRALARDRDADPAATALIPAVPGHSCHQAADHGLDRVDGRRPPPAVPDEPAGADLPPSRPGPAAASGWCSSGRTRPARATRASTPSSPARRSAPGCAPASAVTGEILITFGLVVLLFAGYEVWGKSAIVDAHQNDLNQPAGAGVGPRPATRRWRRRPAPTAKPSPPVQRQAARRASTSPSSTRTGSSSRASPSRTSGTPRATTRPAPCPARWATSPSPGHRNRATFWRLDELNDGRRRSWSRARPTGTSTG